MKLGIKSCQLIERKSIILEKISRTETKIKKGTAMPFMKVLNEYLDK
jgi:hypothetical protein